MIVSELKQHCPHQVTLGNTTLFPCSVINEELFKITLCKNVTWAFTTRGQLFISEAFSVAVENYSGFCYCFALDLISSLQSSVGSFWWWKGVLSRCFSHCLMCHSLKRLSFTAAASFVSHVVLRADWMDDTLVGWPLLWYTLVLHTRIQSPVSLPCRLTHV